MSGPTVPQPGTNLPTKIAGKDFSPGGAKELTKVIATLTQSVGTLAAIIATQKGSDTVSKQHVELAAEKLDLVSPPLLRQVGETVAVFLLGAVVSTLIGLVAGGQHLSPATWVCLVTIAVLLAPAAALLWWANRRR